MHRFALPPDAAPAQPRGAELSTFGIVLFRDAQLSALFLQPQLYKMQGKERIEAALALLDVSCDRIDDAGCSPSAEEATLSSLPFEVLITIAADLLPAGGLSDTHAAWSAAMNFTSASHLTNAALVEAIRARIPVAIPEDWRFSPAGLFAHINSLLSGGGGRSKWRRLRPVQAVRAQSTHSVPVQAAPRLSGASLCRVAKERLVLYGGRDTASSDTLDHTHFATVRSGAVLWSKLLLHSAHGPRLPRDAITQPPRSRAMDPRRRIRWWCLGHR